MTTKETLRHNIGVTFDFLRQLISNPSMLKRIHNGATIEFVQKDIPIKEHRSGTKRRKFVKVVRQFETL
jgi:hypothetical protein